MRYLWICLQFQAASRDKSRQFKHDLSYFSSLSFCLNLVHIPETFSWMVSLLQESRLLNVSSDTFSQTLTSLLIWIIVFNF